MNFSAIGTVGHLVIKSAGKAKFWACKHAPELLTAAGVVGFGGTIYLACKGTIKAVEVLEVECENKAFIESAYNDCDNYSRADKDLDLKVVKIKTIKGVGMAYAPAAICGTLTLSCFLGSDYILKKRNIALVAAYNMLDDGFKSYRKRVVDKYGEEEDFRLNSGVSVEKETITEIGEDGKKHKKKVDINVLDGDVSGYTFIFDNKHSMMNVTDPYIVRSDLLAAQNSANRLLKARGYITLNEVLRAIGLHETSAGQIVGWQTKGNGDGYIDFGIQQIRTSMDEDGLAYLLDFNVDGPIYQDIDKYTRMWGE